MTDADKPAFAQAMARLCVALREKNPDALQMRTYFDALVDVPIEFVTAAADELGRTAQFFPRAPEWRLAATAIEFRRRDAQRQQLRRAGVPACTTCGDTGFVLDEATNRASRCTCRNEREQEVLGHRDLPQLPDRSASDLDQGQIDQQMDRIKAMIKPAIRSMPRARSIVITPEFEKAAEDDPILAAELARKRGRSEASQ